MAGDDQARRDRPEAVERLAPGGGRLGVVGGTGPVQLLVHVVGVVAQVGQLPLDAVGVGGGLVVERLAGVHGRGDWAVRPDGIRTSRSLYGGRMLCDLCGRAWVAGRLDGPA